MFNSRKKPFLFGIIGLVFAFTTSCSVTRKTTPTVFKKEVKATYYHSKFDRKRTASGEKFHNSRMTAAHRTLPFGTVVEVVNKKNKKTVQVKINDRGPFTKGREIDLSQKAFKQLGASKGEGVITVDLYIVP